jgi:hypothetical protein
MSRQDERKPNQVAATSSSAPSPTTDLAPSGDGLDSQTKEAVVPEAKAQVDPGPIATFEAHALATNTPAWLVAAVTTKHELVQGQEMTEAMFKSLVDTTVNETLK